MKRYHAMIWLGVALVAAGGYRLIAPFHTSVGTVSTSCGNAVAYLDGQDKQAIFATTLSVCSQQLKQAALEGGVGGGVGLVLFVVGLVLYVRNHRRRTLSRRAYAHQQAAQAAQAHAHSAPPATAYASAPDAGAGQAPPTPPPSGPATTAAMPARGVQGAEVYEQFMRLGRLTRPKTVLSFFAILFAALVAGSVVAISLLLKHPDTEHDIPWILVFDAIVAIVLIIGVFVTITKDPARLMLSEIANQNSVALSRGRRHDDPPLNAITVQRVAPDQGSGGAGAQYRRRWNDPKE